MNARKKRIAENEISRMYTFSLGGYPQKVLIEGKKQDLPIVLFLHGGPGTPLPFNAGCRGLFPEFTDHFIMVYWDQPGCGINCSCLDIGMTIDNFIELAANLISILRDMFPGNRLLIFSTSWGSVLSAKLLEAGADIDGVVSWGQITRHALLSEFSLNALEHSKAPRKKLEKLRTLQPETAGNRDLQLLSTCLRKYTDAYFHSQGAKPPMGPIIRGMLTSPDYSFRDFAAIMKNGYTDNPGFFTRLFREVMALDLEPALLNAKVPCRMLQGDADTVAPTAYVQALAERGGNPFLTCEIINNSGHFPTENAMKRIFEVLSELSAEETGDKK